MDTTKQRITVNGIAVELEQGLDWKARTIYFASVAGVRRSFNTQDWALEWTRQALEACTRGQA